MEILSTLFTFLLFLRFSSAGHRHLHGRQPEQGYGSSSSSTTDTCTASKSSTSSVVTHSSSKSCTSITTLSTSTRASTTSCTDSASHSSEKSSFTVEKPTSPVSYPTATASSNTLSSSISKSSQSSSSSHSPSLSSSTASHSSTSTSTKPNVSYSSTKPTSSTTSPVSSPSSSVISSSGSTRGSDVSTSSTTKTTSTTKSTPTSSPSSTTTSVSSSSHSTPSTTTTTSKSLVSSSTTTKSSSASSATTSVSSTSSSSSRVTTTTSSTLSSSTLTSSSSTKSSSTSTSSTCNPTPTAGAGKRGLSYNYTPVTELFSNKGCSASGGSSKVSWAYNWFSAPHDPKLGPSPGPLHPYLQFVPMLWSAHPDLTSVWFDNVAEAKKRGWNEVLGFNEPDLCGDDGAGASCMSVEDAVVAYKKWITPLKAQGFRLGAPAVTNGQGLNIGNDWLVKFLAQCSDCGIDFLPIHWYGQYDEFDSFFSNLYYTHDIVGDGKYPIWLTEFGVTTGTDAQVQNFMQIVNAALDDPSRSWVEKYAWYMAGKPGTLPGNLVAANQSSLTEFGQSYDKM